MWAARLLQESQPSRLCGHDLRWKEESTDQRHGWVNYVKCRTFLIWWNQIFPKWKRNSVNLGNSENHTYSDGSRISQEGHQPQIGDTNLLLDIIFAEKCMKICKNLSNDIHEMKSLINKSAHLPPSNYRKTGRTFPQMLWALQIQ